MSGLIKNNTHIPSLTQTASYRIPDGLDMGAKILSEVKNYSGTLSYTNQLKDFVLWSQAQGFQMHLYTNATLSGPLQQVVDEWYNSVVSVRMRGKAMGINDTCNSKIQYR